MCVHVCVLQRNTRYRKYAISHFVWICEHACGCTLLLLLPVFGVLPSLWGPFPVTAEGNSTECNPMFASSLLAACIDVEERFSPCSVPQGISAHSPIPLTDGSCLVQFQYRFLLAFPISVQLFFFFFFWLPVWHSSICSNGKCPKVGEIYVWQPLH